MPRYKVTGHVTVSCQAYVDAPDAAAALHAAGEIGPVVLSDRGLDGCGYDPGEAWAISDGDGVPEPGRAEEVADDAGE